MRTFFISFIISILSFGHAILATELTPWFGNVMEFEFRSSYSLRQYNTVDTPRGSENYSSDDHLLDLSLMLTPVTQWCGEIEMLVARTSAQGFSVAHLRATGRYLWMDDIIGEPFSFTTGLSLTVPVKTSQGDISLGYHGDVEAEFHGAIGRELACRNSWLARGWTIVAVGIANVGSPWIRFNAGVEGNCNECHRVRLFAEGRWGVGRHDIEVSKDHFSGYGHIDHRSIDVGIRYSYLINYCGILGFEYYHRVLSKNYPEAINSYTISYIMPFSL